MKPLKLIALDREDVEVVSAHLQDSVVKVSDIRWRPAEKRLVIGLNRFDWEAANAANPQFRRRQAALRFERVAVCKCRNCTAKEKDQLLNLLAISFQETDGPAGVITLTFSGGAALRVEVECLEAELVDLGPWSAAECCPAHVIDGESVATAEQAGLSRQG